MAQPDGSVALCRPLEKDVYEQQVQQYKRKDTCKSKLKGCICLHQRSTQSPHEDYEEVSRPQAQLIQ